MLIDERKARARVVAKPTWWRISMRRLFSSSTLYIAATMAVENAALILHAQMVSFQDALYMEHGHQVKKMQTGVYCLNQPWTGAWDRRRSSAAPFLQVGVPVEEQWRRTSCELCEKWIEIMSHYPDNDGPSRSAPIKHSMWPIKPNIFGMEQDVHIASARKLHAYP